MKGALTTELRGHVETLHSAGIRNPLRMARLMAETVDRFRLNLSGLTVVTEAASGLFSVTPVVAALAGAKKVYGITRDSPYASADDVCKQTRALASICGEADRIALVLEKIDVPFEQADIVTNLGFVRPIDKALVGLLRPGTVICAMCEAWEIRPGDIDIDECKRKGILVLGTNEHCPGYDIFGFSGDVAIQLLLEAQVELHKSNIAVVSSDSFGPVIVSALRNAGARAELLASLKEIDGSHLGTFDACVLADYNRRDLMIGDKGDITVEFLAKHAPHATIIQFAGPCSVDQLIEAGITVYPGIPLPAQRMARTFAAIGPRPVIELHAAGLKVGEIGVREKSSMQSNPLVQIMVQ
jgi:hypothetical protein